jgi:hypothetical protein
MRCACCKSERNSWPRTLQLLPQHLERRTVVFFQFDEEVLEWVRDASCIDDNQKVGWAQCANLGIKHSSRAPLPMQRWPVGNGEAAVAHRTISASDETRGAD